MTDANATADGATFPRMPEGEFAYLHFAGGRFEEESAEGMPLETVVELATFRDLVVEVARHLWKKSHPERVRAPRNFGSTLTLRLTGIGGGSVTPYVSRYETASTLIDDEFEASRDLITRTVDAINTQGSLPSEFPRMQVARLSRWGATLAPGESFDFGHPVDTTMRTQFNQSTATVLQRIAEDLSTAQPTTVRGNVVEVDVESRTFQVRTSAGRRIPGAIFHSESVDAVFDSLSADDDETLLEVSGLAMVDHEGSALRFFGPVNVVKVPDIGISFASSALWNAANAEIDNILIPGAVLKVMRERVGSLAAHYPSLGIAATEGGGLRVEWTAGDVECSVDFDADGQVFMHAYNAEDDTDQAWEGELRIGLSRLDRFIGESRLD